MSDDSLSNEDLLEQLVNAQHRLTTATWVHDGSPGSCERCDGASVDVEAARAAVLSRMSSPSHDRAMAEGGWRETAARIAENPGFIQARDTEWDEGVNYAKRYIAAAIRSAPPTPTTKEEKAK